MNTNEADDSNAPPPDAPPVIPFPFNENTPIIKFENLAEGGTTVLIQLDDAVYTLKKTRNNRLILQK